MHVCACVCVCAGAFVRACVCACARARVCVLNPPYLTNAERSGHQTCRDVSRLCCNEFIILSRLRTAGSNTYIYNLFV